MKNFRLSANCVKSAMVTMAKNDVRYYLNGLLIGDKKIVSTDGHRMTVIECEQADFEPKIFAIKGNLLKSACECEFVFIGEDHGVIMTRSAGKQEQDKVVKFSVVDGRFPDWRRVMPQGKPIKVEKVGFNIGYVADINKTAQHLGNSYSIGAFTFYGGEKAAIEISTGEHKATVVIMQARL